MEAVKELVKFVQATAKSKTVWACIVVGSFVLLATHKSIHVKAAGVDISIDEQKDIAPVSTNPPTITK